MLINFNIGPTIAKVPRRGSGSAAFYRPYARFVQADPIGFADGLNLYSYADSDPVNLVDPLGLSVQEIVVTYRRKRDSSGGITWGSVPSAGSSSSDFEPEPPVEQEIVVTGKRLRKTRGVRAPVLQRVGRCAAEQFGLTDVLSDAGLIAAGQPIPGTKPFVNKGSSRGTSVAGKAADAIFGGAKLPMRLPTIVGGTPGSRLRISGTIKAARLPDEPCLW